MIPANSSTKRRANDKLAENIERMAELQNVLYAEDKHALLIVLQAMDVGGKDGTIRSIMSGVNPQGVQVTSFKKPTEEELSHDFLWRVHRAVPPRGMIGIFNRSHYEDVLVVRVHNLVPKAVWQTRYEHINNFERLLGNSGVTILKFYLHISKEEQKERFQARLDQPHKRWKFNPGDLGERTLWNDYMQAFEAAFAQCSTEAAPLVHCPRQQEMVSQFGHFRGNCADIGGIKPQIPGPGQRAGQYRHQVKRRAACTVTKRWRKSPGTI